MLDTELPLHRLSVEDVFRMAEVGIFAEGTRVELIDGVLVDMISPSPEHSGAVSWLTRHFVGGSTRQEVRVQDLLLVEGGFVLPDLMVIERLARDRHPSTALLVVEVSVSTLRHDTAKATRYARAAVDEYWLVDLPARVVRVHSEVRPDGYLHVDAHRDGAVLAAPGGAADVVVSQLLGPSAG